MQTYWNLDLKCRRRQLLGPVYYWDFRETGPRTIDARQVFWSGKKKLKTSVQLCFLLPARKQDKHTTGDSHFFKHLSCRFFLSPPVSVYYVIIPIKQYISVQGYKQIFIIYLSNFQFYHWRQGGVSGPVLCVKHSHAICLFWSDWIIREMSLLLVFLSAPLVNKGIWK